MTSKIHLLCRGRDGLNVVDKLKHIYESHSWLLSASDAETLKGGDVLLHERKSEPSYFGGTVLEVRPEEPFGAATRTRCVLIVQSTLACKGVPWDSRGHTHGMAWASGVLPSE